MTSLGRTRRRSTVGLSLAFYAVVAIAFGLGVGGVSIPLYSFQLLDPELLTADFWEAIYHLHSQPPVLNFLLGVVLHAAAALGTSPQSLLTPLQFALGAVIVWQYSSLVEDLVEGVVGRMVVLALLLANPFFYSTVYTFFYTLLELLLLLIAVDQAGRFWRGRAGFVRVCVPVVLLTLSRSLFHPAWAIMVLCGVFLASQDRRDRLRQGAISIALVAFVLSIWPAKNLLQFGFFGYSSWQGYNLSRGLGVEKHELSELFGLRDRDRTEVIAVADRLIPDDYRDVEVLTQPLKGKRAPNWNHYSVIVFSRDLGDAALEKLRQNPALLWKKSWRNLRSALSLSPMRNPYSGRFREKAYPSWSGPWIWTYEVFTLRRHEDLRSWSWFGLLFGPVFVLSLGRGLLRRTRGRRRALLLTACVAWVLLLIAAVDGREGNRIRFSTEPLVWLVVGWGLSRDATPAASCDIVQPGGVPLA